MREDKFTWSMDEEELIQVRRREVQMEMREIQNWNEEEQTQMQSLIDKRGLV